MSLTFLCLSLVWTGMVAGAAEAFTRGPVRPHFAQTVWRMGAGLMALPWLALAAFALFPAAPLILPEISHFGELGQADAAIGAAVTAALPLKSTPQINLPALLMAFLITGWTVRGIAYALSHARLNALQSAARPVSNLRLVTDMQNWTNQLGLARTPELAIIPGHRSPFVAGLFTRTLYLPASLEKAPHASLIIAHECVHIARGDLATRPVERAIADLLWFSPFAWLARARLDYYREAVCDAETVALTNAPVAYARALANVARAVSKTPVLPVAAFILPQKRKTLPMRISAILTPSPATPRLRTGLASAVALIALPFALAQGVQGQPANSPQVFSAPVITHADARITSPYGERPNPFKPGTTAYHSGVDIGAPIGASVQTPGGATVLFAGRKSDAYGNVVDLQLTQSGDIMRFSQLSEVTVQTGDTLLAGTQVGLVGKSGRATGPHLHLEYMRPETDGDAGAVSHDDPQTVPGLVIIG